MHIAYEATMRDRAPNDFEKELWQAWEGTIILPVTFGELATRNVRRRSSFCFQHWLFGFILQAQKQASRARGPGQAGCNSQDAYFCSSYVSFPSQLQLQVSLLGWRYAHPQKPALCCLLKCLLLKVCPTCHYSIGWIVHCCRACHGSGSLWTGAAIGFGVLKSYQGACEHRKA